MMALGSRQTRVLISLASVALIVLAAGFMASTFSAFSGTTGNAANSAAAGTVVIGDNDATTAMLTMTGLKPGDTDSACITVTSTGTLPSLVRLYGTTGGNGLDAYLNLVVTRGTGAAGFDDCTGFTANTTNYLGAGNGVIYSGTLQAFADTYAAGIADPRTATIPEAWTTGETHTYRFALTQADNDAAQGLTYTQTFTWEARNTTLYSQVVLSDQPASYWKLDEAAGTSAADAAGTATGTYTNGPVLNQASGVKDAGTAVTFDGSNDYIGFGDVHDFTGTASFSVEMWFRWTGAGSGSWQRLLGKTDYTSTNNRQGWNLYLSDSWAPGNRLKFERWGGTSDYVYAAPVIAPNTWYHVVATYNGSTLTVYVNGASQGSGAATTPIGNSTGALQLANNEAFTSLNFAGAVDEVAIYSTPLSAQQVTEHYNAGKR